MAAAVKISGEKQKASVIYDAPFLAVFFERDEEAAKVLLVEEGIDQPPTWVGLDSLAD